MISVCMATYNGEKYLKEQLDSILLQIEAEDEVVISDDGSTDGTLALIDSYGDKRIKLVHGGFRNFKRNFVHSLTHAKGDIIFLSDQDDVWMPTKYIQCVELLSWYDLVLTDSVIVDEQLNMLFPSFFHHYGVKKGVFWNILHNSYFGASMAFRREVLERAYPFPETDEIGHDCWLGLVADAKMRVCFYKVPLLLYRRHNNTVTNVTLPLLKRSKRGFFTKIAARFIVMWNVIKIIAR